MPGDNKDLHEKVLELIRNAISRDEELRAQHAVGDKFRFVRDRLQALLAGLEGSMAAEVAEKKSHEEIIADEVVVYIYLYNAEGIVVRNWQNMLTPKVFYEYSVNRPIYTEKQHVEAFVQAKINKAQHAYVTIAIKKADILGGAAIEDARGNAVVRVREGALRFQKLIAFTHNGIDYRVDDEGELIKKN